MCGIVGLISAGKIEEELLRRMTERLAHRGPDDQGLWVDPDARVGPGHRRLAIVDLGRGVHEAPGSTVS